MSSKQEAGNWGIKVFPQELRNIIKKIVDNYENDDIHTFDEEELIQLRDYINRKVNELE